VKELFGFPHHADAGVYTDTIHAKLEVSIEHIPHANVYGIECYNYLSSADIDGATPRD